MRRTTMLLLTLALVTTLAGLQPAAAGVGTWSAPFWEGSLPLPTTAQESRDALPTAVSAVVMPNGKVVYWDGLAGLSKCNAPLPADAGRCAKNGETRVLDLTGLFPAWSTPGNKTGGKGDLFCADQRLLADGRVLAAGGTVWANDPVDLTPYTNDGEILAGGPAGNAELFGNDAARTFANNAWDDAGIPDMAHGRWYPTAVTLNNGRIFVAGGTPRLVYNAPVFPSGTGTNVVETETFNPASNTWTQNPASANATLPLFARMHLMPDGKVLYNGTGQMWSPMGQGYDEAAWNFHAAYDPASQTWSQAGMGNFGARSGALSVLLPLKASDGYQARMLLAGGTIGVTPSSYVATTITEIVTYAGGTTTSAMGPALNNRRWYSSGVLLPNGNVLALSGADKDEVLVPGTEQAVHQAEMFDGTQWIPLSSGARDRTYHNSAVLLPDGTVLVGGHSPINYLYGDSGNNAGHDAGLSANNFKDYSFEIFTPPYLDGSPARPQIGGSGTTSNLPASITHASALSIPTATDGNDVAKVALVRLPSATHTTDADMRMIELSITSKGTSAVNVTTPPNANVAPPGYYYVFLLDAAGVPSKAAIVNIGGSASGSAPAPFGL